LEELTLHGTPIKALPDLPPSLRNLTTHDCASLETVTSIINIDRDGLDFTNCFKLDQKQQVAAMHLKIQVSLLTPLSFFLSSLFLACFIAFSKREFCVTVRTGYPTWHNWNGSTGEWNSRMVRWQRNWIFTHHTVSLKLSSAHQNCFLPCLSIPSFLPGHEVYDDSYANVYYGYHVKSKNGEHVKDMPYGALTYNLKTCDSDHMILYYEPWFNLVYHLREYSGNEVTFKFYNGVDCFKLKSCGLYLHFDENLSADKSSEENWGRNKINWKGERVL